MSKIKILEIIGDSSLAGAPRHLLSILDNIDQKKFDCFCLVPAGPLAGELRAISGINVEIVSMPSRTDIGSIFAIRKLIKHIEPNVIHVHGTRAGSLGRFAAIGMGIPVIYTEHLWTENYKVKSRLNHTLQLVALWFLDMFTTLNIAVSESVRDFMIKNQISRPAKIKVVYNGIEDQTQKAPIFSKSEIILGSVGTLNFLKGMQFLIASLPKILLEFPKTKLVIVGEGPYRANLEKLVKKLKLQKSVEFKGFVKDVKKELMKFDIYVQPSLSESFGLSIVQAMSLGIPVVASSAGGIPEVVANDVTGLLVPPSNPEAISDAVLDLMRNHEKAKKMGKIGADEAKVKFNLKDMVSQVEQIYEQMA